MSPARNPIISGGQLRGVSTRELVLLSLAMGVPDQRSGHRELHGEFLALQGDRQRRQGPRGSGVPPGKE